MENQEINMNVDDGPTTTSSSSNVRGRRVRISSDLRLLAIQRSSKAILHTSQCDNTNNCRVPCCREMQLLVYHTRACRRARCLICKPVLLACFYHAKRCQERNCPVLYCGAIKRRLEILIRLQQSEQLRIQMTSRLSSITTTTPSQSRTVQMQQALSTRPEKISKILTLELKDVMTPPAS